MPSGALGIAFERHDTPFAGWMVGVSTDVDANPPEHSTQDNQRSRGKHIGHVDLHVPGVSQRQRNGRRQANGKEMVNAVLYFG